MHTLTRTTLFLASVFLLPAAASAAGKCTLPKLEQTSSDSPDCLFYTGTAHFREKRYPAAVASWQHLLRLSGVPVESEHLQTKAYNNLGYMYFMGWGVKADEAKAQQYWLTAYKAGHDEAAYHLCHFYGDADSVHYAPTIALSYCREALDRYEHRQSEGEGEVLRQLKTYIRKLETH